MLLLKINKLSRGLFVELSKYEKSIEDALLKSQGSLRNLHGLEMENTALRHSLDNCNFFTWVKRKEYLL